MAVLQSTLKLTLLDQVSARARAVTSALNGIQNTNRRMMTPLMGGMAQFLALAGAYVGVTQGIQSTIGAAISFESAFADVKKVVEASDLQFQQMEKNIRGLSTVIPTTANDLAALYAAAASSGIATDELNKFALMAAQVGVAFDMPAAQAGESLAKLKTQLGLSLTETGDLTDVINHLGNTMASKESDITAFMLRVGALAKISGLAKEETAAIGSAMISAGAEPETAATALQNVIKAMTRGGSAKKSQKDAAKALGLNLPDLAKQMQKDAPSAIKKVLKAIAKAPKDRHISLLSDFFGDEAKAFAPLVGNIKLLDDALNSVADSTKYAGSAYKDYLARADTVGNVLQVMQNKFSEFGRSIGDGMLPGVKEFALGIGDILDTFSERANIFEDIKWAIQGLSQGLGFTGGIRETINELGDALFGEAKGPKEKQAHIAAVFASFREFGANIKYVIDQIDAAFTRFDEAFNLKPGTAKDTLKEIAGWGLTLGVASIGIGLAAAAIGALGRALFVLSGASLLVGGAKGIASLMTAVSGVAPSAGKVVNTAAAGAKAVTAVKPGGMPIGAKIAAEWDKLGKFGKVATILQAVSGAYDAVKNSTPEGMKDNVNGARSFWNSATEFLFGADIAKQSFSATPVEGAALEKSNGWDRLGYLLGEVDRKLSMTTPTVQAGVGQQMAIQNSMFPGKQKDDFDMGRKTVTIDAASIQAMASPRGVQQVHVVNQQPISVPVNAPITITGVIDPRAAASSAASQLGEKVRSAVESANTD